MRVCQLVSTSTPITHSGTGELTQGGGVCGSTRPSGTPFIASVHPGGYVGGCSGLTQQMQPDVAASRSLSTPSPVLCQDSAVISTDLLQTNSVAKAFEAIPAALADGLRVWTPRRVAHIDGLPFLHLISSLPG